MVSKEEFAAIQADFIDSQGFIVLTTGIKPSPSGETFRFFGF